MGAWAALAALLALASAMPVQAQAPYLVKDINPLLGGPGDGNPAYLAAVGSQVFFRGCDLHGCELWKSDGTAGGTVLVKDIYPGATGSNLWNLTNVNGTLFFQANDGSHGGELWKSDGTAAGTVLVKDINPGAFASGPDWLTNVNGMLFFQADDGTHGSELWKSDGTAAGTVLVKDININPGEPGSGCYQLTNVNGTLFFGAYDGTTGELWKSDGTAAGTVLVKDIDPATGSYPYWLTNVNGTLFFQTDDGTHGPELWKSDGTAAGTVLVKDIYPGATDSQPSGLTNVNGTLFFQANDGTNGLELWKSDGTAAGTVLVKDINPGAAGSVPSGLTNVNGTLFFQANDGTTGDELWKSDGTAAGTVLVKDIDLGISGASPSSLMLAGPCLYFSADDGVTGRELWALVVAATADLSVTKTDGQTAALPGQPVTYTIVVSNAGPNFAIAATVSDALPAPLTGASWTCTASPGSSCSASGAGNISDNVNLLVGGTASYTLTATIDPAATGALANTASAAVAAGTTDPDPANNAATDTDTLTPEADLELVKSDLPDPVAAGGPLTYSIQLRNLGPSASTGMSMTDTLPPEVAFLASTPGSPTCTEAVGTVTCGLPGLAPGASHSVSIQTRVNAVAQGTTFSNTATVTGNEADPVAGNGSDMEPTTVGPPTESELVQGTVAWADLESVGGVPNVDLYRIGEKPYSSYEVVVDGTSGDIGTGQGPELDRLASDATSVLQSSVAAGAAASRSLRWENDTAAVNAAYVRVRSAGCTTTCGPEDVYRIRAWDTTLVCPRFNNNGTQVTVLVLQNTTGATVSGHAHFWGTAGGLVASQAFTLGPEAVFVVNTSGVTGATGAEGTITVSHDGPYGTLVGKAVAVEPSTGFTFDTSLEPRSR